MRSLIYRLHAYYSDPQMGGFLTRGESRALGMSIVVSLLAVVLIEVLAPH